MSTEKERQSLRLVHTDPRYAEVKSAHRHLYIWIRDGGWTKRRTVIPSSLVTALRFTAA